MIVCSQCHHQNADHLSQCEACCAQLPISFCCPACGSHHPQGAKFCGQCGESLQDELSASSPQSLAEGTFDWPELPPPEPQVEISLQKHDDTPATAITAVQAFANETLRPKSSTFNRSTSEKTERWEPLKATLVHRDTQFEFHLNPHTSPIHLGKPNRKVMPDINLSTFKHSEVVSRIHADIFIENNQFFIQDSGSANGTFVNNQRIRPGHPHTLAPGDRISLGKGDLVTFTFELS